MPPGGGGFYYFSTYLLTNAGEFARVDMRLNDDVICSTRPDHNSNGASDNAVGSCSASLEIVAGKSC